jgi:hypothetical protein
MIRSKGLGRGDLGPGLQEIANYSQYPRNHSEQQTCNSQFDCSEKRWSEGTTFAFFRGAQPRSST